MESGCKLTRNVNVILCTCQQGGTYAILNVSTREMAYQSPVSYPDPPHIYFRSFHYKHTPSAAEMGGSGYETN